MDVGGTHTQPTQRCGRPPPPREKENISRRCTCAHAQTTCFSSPLLAFTSTESPTFYPREVLGNKAARGGGGIISHIITGNSVVCLLRPLCFAKRICKNRNENAQVRHTGTQRKWSTGEGDEQGNAVEHQNKRNNNKKKHTENNESFFFSPLFRF